MLVLDDIITALDSKQVYIATFIDLAKDFDSLDHSILLHRLSSIGLSTTCCDWFASYLADLYANDTILYSVGPSLHSTAFTLQLNFTSAEQSSHNLHLLLHGSKTNFIIFDWENVASSPPKISCADGSALDYLNSYKYLDMWLDSSLSFTHQQPSDNSQSQTSFPLPQ